MEKKTGEAMPLSAVQNSMRIFSLLCLMAFLISKATAADPAAEMASFSVFSGINVAELAKGEADDAGLRVERGVVSRAIASAASRAVDEQRAKVVRDA